MTLTAAPGRAIYALRSGTLTRIDRVRDFLLTSAAVVADKTAYATLYSTTPAAIYDATSRKTFIAYLGVARGCYVTSYDHLTGVLAPPVLVGSYTAAVDDNHGAPSIALDQTGRLVIVYGDHNAPYQFARSTGVRDITGWTVSTLPFACTYPNLRLHPASGDLFIFGRAGTTHGSSFPAHEFEGRFRSLDNGATWASTAVMDLTGFPEATADPYVYDVKLGPDGWFWFGWTVARGAAHDGTRLDVYCARWNPATQTWTNAAGTSLGAILDATAHSSCRVATVGTLDVSEVGGIRLAFHPATGRPWMVYTDDAMVPHVTEWTGSAWANTALPVTQSWTFAFCDLRFRTNGDLDVYVPGVRPAGNVSHLQRWTNASGSWALAGYVAAGQPGTAGVERAQVPLGAHDSLAVLFQSLAYDRTAGTPTATADTVPLRAAPASLVIADPGGRVAFRDDFARADSGSTGNGWTLVQGAVAMPIVSGQVGLSGTTVISVFNKAPATMLTADQFAQVDVTVFPATATTAHPNVGVRWVQVSSTDQSGYYGRYNPGTAVWELYRIVNNVSTQIGTFADTLPAAPYTLRIEAVGSTITLKANGVTKVTVTDATLTAGRAAELGMRRAATADNNQRVDNFVCGDL